MSLASDPSDKNTSHTTDARPGRALHFPGPQAVCLLVSLCLSLKSRLAPAIGPLVGYGTLGKSKTLLLHRHSKSLAFSLWFGLPAVARLAPQYPSWWTWTWAAAALSLLFFATPPDLLLRVISQDPAPYTCTALATSLLPENKTPGGRGSLTGVTISKPPSVNDIVLR